MTKPNFFSRGSPYLKHPALTQERTALEIDFVLSQADLTPGSRVLDVGCGPGRHSVELARRGYDVLGIDSSEAMIEAAREQASEIHRAPKFIVARGEDFSTDIPFDAALCLFTSLGQMDESGDNHRLIDRVAKNLRPGGTFIIEVPQRNWIAKNLQTSDRFRNGESFTYVERSFDPNKNVVTEIFTVISLQERHIYLLRYRLFSAPELRALLEDAGFKVTAMYGGYDASPLNAGCPIMIMVARKLPKHPISQRAEPILPLL